MIKYKINFIIIKMVLTGKQKDELNLAIFEYLKNNSYKESASIFELEAEVLHFFK